MEILDNQIFQPIIFPKPQKKGRGIVCVTDFLDTDILISAYLQGIFPWYNEDEGEPVVWWSPDPRFVLLPEDVHIPKRLKRFIKNAPYTYTMDACFKDVIQNCAKAKRPDQDGTWIGQTMMEVYCQLHEMGIAHSVEVWQEGILVGGFYGVLIGKVFCGESMFSLKSDTAKSAFVLFLQTFFESGGKLIDSQVYTDNIARFGAKNISRTAFLRLEKGALTEDIYQTLYDNFQKKVGTKK